MTLDEEERRRAYDALWLKPWRLGRHPEDPGYVNLANDPWDDEWGLTIPAPPASGGLAKVLPFDPARKRKPA